MVLVGFVLFCVKALQHMKKCLNFDGLSGQEKIWQHFSINCSKIGQSYQTPCSYEAIKYLFGQDISTRLLSANWNSSADHLKFGVTGNFGLIVILGLRLFIFSQGP